MSPPEPQPSTEQVQFVVCSTIAGQCASVLEALQKINPPARFDLASTLFNDHAISRKLGGEKMSEKRRPRRKYGDDEPWKEKDL